jgi:glutamate synthase (NADPH/NADH) small chain
LQLVDVEPHEGGFRPVEGSSREIPADAVFLAMGFVGPEAGTLVEQLGLTLNERGGIVRDAGYRSDVPGVFVAGDAGRGQSLIVWAIAEGRAAAAAVDAHLMGSTNLPSPIPATARPLLV